MKRVTSEGEWTCTVADTPLAALPSRPAFQQFGETGRLAAPFVATAARFAIEERCSRSPMIHVRAKLQLAEGGRRGVAREEIGGPTWLRRIS